MADGDADDRRLDVLTDRTGVLRRLLAGPAHPRDLVDELDVSRSTVNRAVNDLQATGLVERTDDGYVATMAGRFAIERLERFREALGDFVAVEAALTPLPVDTPLADAVVVGAEAVLATEPMPYRPLERVHAQLVETTEYRALVPVLDDPRHVRLLYEHVVTADNPATIVVSESVFETLREEFPRRIAAMAERDGFRIRVAGDLPPFTLAWFDDDSGITVAVVVFTDSGAVHGVLVNDAEDAVAWVDERIETIAASASDRTEALRISTDGGTLVDQGTFGTFDPSLSVALEREGFVRLGVPYFGEATVADPVTAWRTGLSLAEVHIGYAVERGAAATGKGPTDGRATLEDGSSLSERLESRLVAGTDCVVVGPPGSGKSTLCKQVACRWYDDDRGPVLYRDGGQGRPFASVDPLVEQVEVADGHALVVVEDAARPATEAVFDAIDRLADRPDASVLLDSRETEWRDADRRPTVSDVDVVHVPRLEAADCERLVDHFERTLGEDVDVPVDRLWAEVREEVRAEDTAASGMVLLLHRLAAYADPFAGGRTTLESETATLAASLADDDLALSVCVLANALNAAGLGVARDALFAVAEPAAFEAVDGAIDRIEGQVLFPEPDGGYRAVHESWSVAFLAQLRDVLGEGRAADLFGNAVSTLLALATDPRQRESIVSHLGDGPTIAAVETGPPETWARETVEGFADLARDRPKLAPLFGDGSEDTVTLPDCCDGETRRRWLAWLGEAFLDGGYYHRAERVFRRLEGTPAGDAQWSLGLARVATARGEYETAVEHARASLDVAGTLDDPSLHGRGRLELGKALLRLGDHEAARGHLETAIEQFESAGDRGRVGTAATFLGRIAMREGEFERARDHLEASLATARERGDRQGAASALNNLGETARHLGEFDRARECHEEALAIRRDIGDRAGVGHSLGNLGIVAALEGDYGGAREYFAESLAIKRDLGGRQGEANTLNNLGNVARREGDYEGAREYFAESLAIKRDLGDRKGVSGTLENLGELTMVLGEYDRAREYFAESLAIRRDLGARKGEASAVGALGELERRSGALAAAERYLETSLDLARDVGDTGERARCHLRLGELARMRGQHDPARERYEEAAEAAQAGGERLDRAKLTLARGRLAFDRDEFETSRERASEARESFLGIGADPWAARSRRLLGRAVAAGGDPDEASEHLTDALETFGAIGASVDELETLLALVEIDGSAGDEWRDRLASVVEAAPEGVVERHRERLDEALDGGP